MKKTLILLSLSVFLLSGCLLKNNSQDVIKITSEKVFENKMTKNGKIISLSTGINLLESGDVDGAIKFFIEYENFYSKNPKYYYYLGQAYLNKKLYNKACSNFEKALSLDNTQYNLFLNIANAYEQANLKNKATENYVNYVFKSNDTSKNSEIRDKLNNLAVQLIGTDIVGRISVTDRADVMKNSALGIMQAFNPDTPLIFASVELINAKKSDKIQVIWNFIGNKGEIIPVNSSKFDILGSKIILLSIKSPVSGWPTGKYEMWVLVNGIKNSSLKFYIF